MISRMMLVIAASESGLPSALLRSAAALSTCASRAGR